MEHGACACRIHEGAPIKLCSSSSSLIEHRNQNAAPAPGQVLTGAGLTCWWARLVALGMTEVPRCMPQASSTWAGVLPSLAAISATLSSCITQQISVLHAFVPYYSYQTSTLPDLAR